MELIIINNDDTRGLGLQRQSPPSSPRFPLGGDADSDSGNLREQNAEVRS
jgi:hypothetical protein